MMNLNFKWTLLTALSLIAILTGDGLFAKEKPPSHPLGAHSSGTSKVDAVNSHIDISGKSHDPLLNQPALDSIHKEKPMNTQQDKVNRDNADRSCRKKTVESADDLVTGTVDAMLGAGIFTTSKQKQAFKRCMENKGF